MSSNVVEDAEREVSKEVVKQKEDVDKKAERDGEDLGICFTRSLCGC